MGILGIHQPGGLDAGGDFHQILVLLQEGNECRAPCAEDFSRVRFLLSHVDGVPVALGKLCQLLVERQKIPCGIKNRDTEPFHRLGGVVAGLPCELHLLVQAGDQRDNTHHVHARQLEGTVQLPCLRRRCMEPFGESIDILPGFHRSLGDGE